MRPFRWPFPAFSFLLLSFLGFPGLPGGTPVLSPASLYAQPTTITDSIPADTGSLRERPWQNALPVLVRNSADTQRFADMLEQGLGLTVVSRFNFPVHVSRFDGESDTVAVSDIDLRLMDDDPRRDPFIRAVPQLFRVEWNNEEAHQIYVLPDAADRSRNELIETVQAAVTQIRGTEERDVYVQRQGRDYSLLLLLLPLSVIPVLISMVEKRRPALITVALVLLGSSIPASGPMPFLFLARTVEFFTLSFTAYAFRIIYRRRGIMHNRLIAPFFVLLALFWLSVFIATVVTSVRTVGLGSVLLLTSGSVLAVAITWMAFFRQRTPDHRLFVAVPLVRESPSPLPPLAMLMLVLVVTISMSLEVQPGQHTFRTPTPVSLSNDGLYDMDAVERAQTEFRAVSANDYRVSVGTYLAHLYYQTALSHVRDARALEFMLPEPGYGIERQRFEQRADGGFRTWTEQVVLFDLQWFETALDTATSLPARLLLGEPGPMLVDLRTVRTGGIVRQPGDVPIFALAGLAVLTVLMYALLHLHARSHPGVAKVRTVTSPKANRRAA